MPPTVTTVTILLEFNCYVPRGPSRSLREWARRALGRADPYETDRASVWIYRGPLPADGPDATPLTETPGMTRITGPVPVTEAERVARVLSEVLTAAGVTVLGRLLRRRLSPPPARQLPRLLTGNRLCSRAPRCTIPHERERHMPRGLIAMIAAVIAAQTASAQLVGVDIRDPNHLVRISTSTGAITEIGPTLAQSPMTGLAWDPNAQVLYAVNPGAKALFKLDPYTGAATRISPIDTFHNVNGLAFDPINNILYASENTNNLLMRVDTATGLPTTIAAITGAQEVEGLAFDPASQTLFGISDLNDRVFRINPMTAAATPLPTSISGNQRWRGLEFDPSTNRLYASTSASGGGANLFWIDPTSGAATFIGNAGGDTAIQGLAIIPAPATTAALAATALLAARRRRKPQ